MPARQSLLSLGEKIGQCRSYLEAGMPIICFDLETTDKKRDASQRILSFSAIKAVYQNGVFTVVSKVDVLINPGFPIPKEATAVNHITDEMVKDQPTEEDLAPRIRAFLGEKPLVCGYNSESFDAAYMNHMYLRQFGEPFEPILHVDVMKMAKEKLHMKHYTLLDVSHELGADAGITFHRSMDDVWATMRCFNVLLREYDGTDVERPKRRYAVEGARYFGPSWQVQRIYVTTKPYTKTYFDAVKKAWVCDDRDDMDLTSLKYDVLHMYQCTDEKALMKHLKTKYELEIEEKRNKT